jgi:hypothetical protein
MVLWFLAVSYCSIEQLFGDAHDHAEAGVSKTVAHHDSDPSQEAEAVEQAHREASHSHNSGQPSHDSHRHNDGDNSCCSTLIATAQITKPFVIAKPILQPLNSLSTVLQACDPMLAAPQDKPESQAKSRDWIFTPEVCLGPAHRSLAPPSLA